MVAPKYGTGVYTMGTTFLFTLIVDTHVTLRHARKDLNDRLHWVYGVSVHDFDPLYCQALNIFRLESYAQNAPTSPIVVIRTGHWGTGAFGTPSSREEPTVITLTLAGGNRVIMCLLQLVAARMAGIDKLTYYTVGDSEPYHEAFDRFSQVPFDITIIFLNVL